MTRFESFLRAAFGQALRPKRRLLTLSLLFVLPWAGSAQQSRSRDLYLQYESGNATAGQPGAKLTVELNREGKTRMVPPATEFRSGDRIRFHLSLNFDSYLAVLNRGSSGNLDCLYPYRGAPNPVHASADLMVPGEEAWFAFDQVPGTEEVTFIMSRDSIQELNDLPADSSTDMEDSGRGVRPAGIPGGNRQIILNKLRSRATQGGRDLHLQFAEDASYGTASEKDLLGLVKFTVLLKHVK